MKELAISVQTGGWLNPMGGEANAEEAFRLIKDCGFEAVDYNIDTPLSWSMINKSDKGDFYTKSIEELLEYFAPVKEAMEKNGVFGAQAHAPFPLFRRSDAEYSEFLMETVEKCLAICQYLGIPALVVHPNTYLDKDSEREINLAMYRKMIPSGKKYGVKLCLENMWAPRAGHIIGGSCYTADEAVWYIDTLNKEAGEDIFGFCFDLGHANLAAAHVRQYLRTLGHRLTVLHLHDNDAVSDQHFAPMTQRKTDWEGLILGLRDINYRGAINFETFGALVNYPEELRPLMLKYIAGVGEYIRAKILEENE